MNTRIASFLLFASLLLPATSILCLATDFDYKPPKGPYYPRVRNNTPVWGFGGFGHLSALRFNVASNAHSILQESYTGGFQSANGIELSRHFLKGRLALHSGIWQSTKNYTNLQEGLFESSEPGLISARYKLQYLSVPVALAIHSNGSKARGFVKYAHWINLLQDANIASSTHGSATEAFRTRFVKTQGDLSPVLQTSSVSAGLDVLIDNRGRLVLRLEPILHFALSSDKTGFSLSDERQYAYGFNAGIQLNYLKGDWLSFKQKRARKLREKQDRIEQNLNDLRYSKS